MGTAPPDRSRLDSVAPGRRSDVVVRHGAVQRAGCISSAASSKGLAQSGVCVNSAGARGHNSPPLLHVQDGKRVGYHLAGLALRHVPANAQAYFDEQRSAFDHAAWPRNLSIAASVRSAGVGLERKSASMTRRAVPRASTVTMPPPGTLPVTPHTAMTLRQFAAFLTKYEFHTIETESPRGAIVPEGALTPSREGDRFFRAILVAPMQYRGRSAIRRSMTPMHGRLTGPIDIRDI